MKTLILLILLFLLFQFPSLLYAQWITQGSGTTENLYDIEFINPATGWALGDAGKIIKTTNSGLNWTTITNPSMTAGGVLVSVFPVNENTTYVVGGHNLLLKTTNGGQNWIELRNGPFGSGNGFSGVYFLNENTGWLCGAQRVLRTTNGCASFDSISVPLSSLTEIHFKDISTGILMSEGYVYKTTNSGFNWFNTNVPHGGNIPFFRKLGVSQNQFVCIGGNDAIIYWSTNYADTWQVRDTVASGIIGVHLIDGNTGFVGGSGNRLYKTTDGGYNWLRENTGAGLVFISSIKFVNTLTGWFIGGIGTIKHTTTGGQTLVGISHQGTEIATQHSLLQNYPNPFNPKTIISYQLVEPEHVMLQIFDATGKLISTVVDSKQQAGRYEIVFDGTGLASGAYFYTLIIEGEVFETKKMLLMQ